MYIDHSKPQPFSFSIETQARHSRDDYKKLVLFKMIDLV